MMLALALPCHMHQQLSSNNITDGQERAGPVVSGPLLLCSGGSWMVPVHTFWRIASSKLRETFGRTGTFQICPHPSRPHLHFPSRDTPPDLSVPLSNTKLSLCPPPPPPPPCVTFRRVVAPLRGPGRSPVLPFACCVGSLRSVGRCGRCSCWCRFRVRGAQWSVCRGCAGCGGMCRLRVNTKLSLCPLPPPLRATPRLRDSRPPE